MHLGQRVFPTISEREELISLATAVVDGSWREVRGCFEAAGRVSSTVDKPLRSKVYSLTEAMAGKGLTNISMFVGEATHCLSTVRKN